MKRFVSVFLLLAMLFTLVSCGNKSVDNGTEDSKSGMVDDANHSKNETPSDSLEIVDHVKSAMEANNHLTTAHYLLAKDGSVIVMQKSYNEYPLTYAQMPNVKKLCASASGLDLLALTEDNSLYRGETKLAENVIDVDYSTTNTNEEGRYLAGSDIFLFNASDTVPTTKTYLSAGTLELTGTPAYMGVDKHAFAVVTDTGNVYLESNGDHECLTWKNMAMVDIARSEDGEDNFLLTIAGIQRDGTVMASGDYASDILSWGELSYIAMGDTMIAGLKKDGTVVMTGQAAEGMGEIVSGWSNIVAIEVGHGARFGDFVSAMDVDGNFYYACYTQNSYFSYMVSPDDGVVEGAAYKYTPDGKIYYSSDSAWEIKD